MENQIAKNIVETVKKHEGFEPKVYKCPTGHDTIGYGFKVSDMYIDEDIAQEMLIRILIHKENQMRNTFDWVDDMPVLVQEVLLNMCYQMGISGFSKFKKTIYYLETEQYEEAADEMLDSLWHKQTPARSQELSDTIRSLA